MRHSTYILLLILFLSSCVNHDIQKVRLYGFENQKEIKYEDDKAIFYLGANDYINLLKEKEVKNPLYNGYGCIIDYVENSEDNPIIISHTLKLKGSRKQVYLNGNDTIEEIIDIYPIDNLRWAIIHFAKKGNLKISLKGETKNVHDLIVDEIEYPNSATVVLKLESGVEIFNQLKWGK